MASFLLMSHAEITRARKMVWVCVKSNRLKIQCTLFCLRSHLSLKMFKYRSSCLDFNIYLNSQSLWILRIIKNIKMSKKGRLLIKRFEATHINPRQNLMFARAISTFPLVCISMSFISTCFHHKNLTYY